MSNESLYYEIQRSPKWLLVNALILLNGMFLFVIVSQYFKRVDMGIETLIDPNILISWSIVILASIFFKIMRLETIIRSNGVYICFYPIQLSYSKVAILASF